MSDEIAFDLILDHGRCVGVRLPPDDAALDAAAHGVLLAEEQDHAAGLLAARRRSWIGGRIAMRFALRAAGIQAPAVLPNARGAPRLPPGIAGSITHKHDIAAALVVRESEACVGVDLEDDVPGSIDISSKVLGEDEIEEIDALLRAPAPAGRDLPSARAAVSAGSADSAARSREVLLRFSAKEALYKALDPFVKRYVGFKEVRVFPLADGTARVALWLSGREGPFAAEVRWQRLDGSILTTAQVRTAASSTA